MGKVYYIIQFVRIMLKFIIGFAPIMFDLFIHNAIGIYVVFIILIIIIYSE